MASSSSSAPATNQVMAEKTNNQTGPNHHQPLQCPRCNSSNTKFCYYNNYSLSQPRHFCKACKRYWTRGGTLRNVPVGGGCRKNKRLKRPPPPPASDGDGTSSAATAVTSNTNSKIDLSTSSNHLHNNPSFYSFPTNNNLLELNYFPFSSFSSTRVCDNNTTGYDFQPQINGVGLGCSSGLMANEVPKQISLTPGNNSIFLGSSDFSSSSTMASLLASSFQQQKVETNGSFKDMINAAANGLVPYEVKSENGSVVMGEDGKFGWNQNPNPNPFEQLNSSDPSSIIWNTNNLGAWFGPSNSNMDSSVPSL